MAPLHESMFLSELSVDTHPSEIGKIVRSSRTHNAVEGLTGLLLFDGANFCQYLEGVEWAVREAMARIAVDSRHTQFRPLHDGVGGTKRRFDAWYVGILAPNGVSPLLEFRSLRGIAAVDHLMKLFRDSRSLGFHAV